VTKGASKFYLSSIFTNPQELLKDLRCDNPDYVCPYQLPLPINFTSISQLATNMLLTSSLVS